MRTTLYISVLQKVPVSLPTVYGQPKTSLELSKRDTIGQLGQIGGVSPSGKDVAIDTILPRHGKNGEKQCQQ